MPPSFNVVLTGPESSGKTTLAAEISERLGWPYCDEVARKYLEKRNGPYFEADLIEIAQLQSQQIKIFSQRYSHFFSDTDLLTIIIWYQEKYGVDSLDLNIWWNDQLPNGYILCAPDIPWEHDPLRENPYDRDRLFTIYENMIIDSGVPYIIASGCVANRTQQVINFINVLRTL